MINYISILHTSLKLSCNISRIYIFRPTGYSDYNGKIDPDYISSFMMEKSRMTSNVVDSCEEVESIIEEKVN